MDGQMPSGSALCPGVLVRETDGRITFWSSEMELRYGFTAANALGHVSYELLRTRSWQTIGEIETVLRSRQIWSGGLIMQRADGEPVITASVWHLHRACVPARECVTEIHFDIVPEPGRRAAALGDVLTTLAGDLGEPLCALDNLVAGAPGAKRPARKMPDPRDSALKEAAGQLDRARELLRRIRLIGETLRNPRSRALHARVVAAYENSERLVRRSSELRAETAALQGPWPLTGFPARGGQGRPANDTILTSPAPIASQLGLRAISLLARGITVKEVALRLSVPARTVAYHRYQVMEANGLRDQADLLRFAVAHGLYAPDGLGDTGSTCCPAAGDSAEQE